MVAMQGVSPETLAEIEDGFRIAWTGAKSTPFIVDAPISEAQRAKATEVVRRISLAVLFQRCPTFAVWSVLTPLAQNYGANTAEVYQHISRFVGEDLDSAYERDALKRSYRHAARKIGLPVSGNEPTELFFAPLGPPRSRYPDLAAAFVATSLSLGPPAIEDTPSARSWQRRAVRERCANIPRLHKTIDFDRSAHCARRFEAWRRGLEPLNSGEAALFEAYDQAAHSWGRSKADLVGPPQIYWTGDCLALEAERSSQMQRIKTGPFPVQIQSGSRHAVSAPWPASINWSFGTTSRDIPFGPDEDHVLVFDADSGVLLTRSEIGTGEIQVAASRLVVLSRREFESPSFGPAMPALDRRYRVAWIAAGERIVFDNHAELDIITPRETAIWIDGQAIGHSGRRALIGGNGALRIQLDPEIGGRTRILRARLGEVIKYASLDLASDGTACVPFSAFGFDAKAAPGKTVFEVLAPGAAGDFEARAELSVATWLWPGFSRPEGPLVEFPRPINFNPTRSAGIRIQGDQLAVDLAASVEPPVLGLDLDDAPHEFQIRTGAEVLRHHRMTTQDKVVVPRGARIFLGHAGRHDTLILQSSDRDADLLVLGNTWRRPFFARSRIEITAERLEQGEGGDDRIALKRKDGRVEIFARITRRDDPRDISVDEDENRTRLSILPQQRCDALRVRVETIEGSLLEGDYALGRHLTDLSPLPGVMVRQDLETGSLHVEIERARYLAPGRTTLWVRHADQGGFQLIKDGAGVAVALGVGRSLAHPDSHALGGLAKMAAEPVAAALAEQNDRSIGRAYRDAMAHIGLRRLVGAVRPALTVSLPSGATPRHDLVGAAPWIFEAAPHAYHGLPGDCGFGPLLRMQSIGAVDNPPDPEGDTPLKSWLSRIGGDDELPQALTASTLTSAFAALRFRIKEGDLGSLLSDDPQGLACACLCNAWIEDIETIRNFDIGGGADPRPARIGAAIERFARACALGRAEAHLDDLVFRTGLSPSEVGTCLTLMLRAGIEIFVYFRALWSQAANTKRETT